MTWSTPLTVLLCQKFTSEIQLTVEAESSYGSKAHSSVLVSPAFLPAPTDLPSSQYAASSQLHDALPLLYCATEYRLIKGCPSGPLVPATACLISFGNGSLSSVLCTTCRVRLVEDERLCKVVRDRPQIRL